jgi:hypothetical protein
LAHRVTFWHALGTVYDREEIRSEAVDRRKTRSADALVALGRLLDGSRRHGGLEAVALADETGFLVAGAGAFRTCEELAAMAPLLAPTPLGATEAANDVVPTRLDVLTRRMAIRRLTIDGVDVLLCGRGADADARASALDHAASGCDRILRERRGTRG